jgi:cell division protein FtsB
MADHPDTPSGTAKTPARRPRIRQRPRTPQEARQWRRRMAGWALAAAAFILVVNALVGENGYLATMRANRESQELAEQYRQLNEENQRMRARIQRLRSDPQELEDAARKELHMSKPGEKMIVIKEAPKPTGTPVPANPGR